MSFIDRVDAGRQLAAVLDRLRDDDVVVLGLPRGGVPVGFEVARALRAPLDVIVVRKLGVPYQPELAMGAIGEDGVRIMNQVVVWSAGIGPCELAAVEHHERAELDRRVRRYRGHRPKIPLTGRIAIVVDDGMATGASAATACQVARAHGARSVIVAVPVASPKAVARLRTEADEVICLETPRHLRAVGQWYADFGQVTDDEVTALLTSAQATEATTANGDRR